MRGEKREEVQGGEKRVCVPGPSRGNYLKETELMKGKRIFGKGVVLRGKEGFEGLECKERSGSSHTRG